MFKRKLNALDYHNANGFNGNGTVNIITGISLSDIMSVAPVSSMDGFSI